MSLMTILEYHTQLDPSKKKKKKKKPKAMNQSVVWSHYTKMEPINKENPKATYNYCNRILGCHWRNDTSALMTHLTSDCPTSPLRKLNISNGQTLLQQSFKKMLEGASNNSNQLRFVKYDPIKVRKLVVQYFINEELPFRHVKSDGFRKLMNEIGSL
jgi:hypothetical protein